MTPQEAQELREALDKALVKFSPIEDEMVAVDPVIIDAAARLLALHDEIGEDNLHEILKHVRHMKEQGLNFSFEDFCKKQKELGAREEWRRLHDAGALEDWYDIATAPRDGTEILLFEDGCIEKMAWKLIPWDYKDYGWCGTSCGPNPDSVTFDSPTHWQTLPKPPQPVSDPDKLQEKQPASFKNQEEN